LKGVPLYPGGNAAGESKHGKSVNINTAAADRVFTAKLERVKSRGASPISNRPANATTRKS
jgi:hypothetical protein